MKGGVSKEKEEYHVPESEKPSTPRLQKKSSYHHIFVNVPYRPADDEDRSRAVDRPFHRESGDGREKLRGLLVLNLAELELHVGNGLFR